jgi:hypothetical protein
MVGYVIMACITAVGLEIAALSETGVAGLPAPTHSTCARSDATTVTAVATMIAAKQIAA